MRKVCFLFVLCVLLVGCGNTPQTSESQKSPKGTYDRIAAAEYARAYAVKRNLDYAELEENCTNFVSQCLVAGGMEMDKGSSPSEDERIRYETSTDLWYSRSEAGTEGKPPHFSVSTSFVRLEDFLTYWQNTKGARVDEYKNNFDGLGRLLDNIRTGDIVIVYDEKGNPAHVGLITAVEKFNAFYCANTTDRLEMSIGGLNMESYPRFRVLSFP